MKTDLKRTIDKFNKALDMLLRLFSGFDRTTQVSVLEVKSQDTPVWYRGDKINIAYCPPNSYVQVPLPILHVRVYEPEKAQPIAALLKGLGLKPEVHDNDPYSKMDIDANLA